MGHEDKIMRAKKGTGQFGKKSQANFGAEPKIKTHFANESVARQWMGQQVNDPCQDKERFAYLDDPSALAKYDEIKKTGCCGFFDEEIDVNGRRAKIGCNFGH